MASMPPDQPVQLSLIDRLLADGPAADQSHRQHQRELRAAVGRDIEALLNTRQRSLSPPAGLAELEVSLVNYGIPDFTGMNLASEDYREQFRRSVETVLSRYEPRFKRVSVILLDNADTLDRTLRFRIDALMYARPEPEPLVFDSELEASSNTFTVRAGKP